MPAAARLDADAIETAVRGADLPALVRRRGPSVVRLRDENGDERFLLVSGARRRSVRLLGPDGDCVRLSRNDASAVVTRAARERAVREIGASLEKTPLPPALGKRLLDHLVEHRVRQAKVADLFLLGPGAGASFPRIARSSRLLAFVATFVSTYALDYGLFLVSWWLLGRSVLSTPVDERWLGLWALSFVLMLPLRMLSTWSEGRIAVAAGGLLKERLLAGAMRLEPDELRADGAGRHLARVFECEAVESLALTGGLLSAAAVIELFIAVPLLASGAGGAVHAFALVGTLLVFFLIARTYVRERRLWTEERLEMSHELVEQMSGHRTLLAQRRIEDENGDDGEEMEALVRYEERSRRVDRLQVVLQSLPRLWLPLGVAALVAPWARTGTGTGTGVGLVAVGVGGTILASRSLTKLVDGFSDLVDAAVAWGRVSPLFRASIRALAPGDPAVPDDAGSTAPLLVSKEVSFRYPGRDRATLETVSFELSRGERVLLTSPSGGGKSTLVSLVNGLRSPRSGELLLDGLDRERLGAARWTRRVATAPQFHENHVFTESFAFNLLMGRRWPPAPGDLQEAESLCREIGLGELLEKMPGGMKQLVGDTGWQLSHGETSRLFLARALLQAKSLVILDECFAALDPENLRRALLCARERPESLLVVAHL